MDPSYKEKLRRFSIGASGGEKAYEEMLRKKGQLRDPIDSSVDAETSQRMKDVQRSLVDQERKQYLPSEVPQVNAMRPPEVSPELEQQMMDELLAEEPQPVVTPKRFNKLLGR